MGGVQWRQRVPATTRSRKREKQESQSRRLKRRGMIAAAGAAVAAVALSATKEPAQALSGGGPDGPLIMGSDAPPNSTSQPTQVFGPINPGGFWFPSPVVPNVVLEV